MSKEVILITEEGREFEDELHKVKCKLCILVFGCAIVDKYKEEIPADTENRHSLVCKLYVKNNREKVLKRKKEYYENT
jgi:hypothetical protein